MGMVTNPPGEQKAEERKGKGEERGGKQRKVKWTWDKVKKCFGQQFVSADPPLNPQGFQIHFFEVFMPQAYRVSERAW